ncbi:uncharacterized protein LOC62_03G004971 [Vanrija pseudolonga]|uniref:Uncharacterized protein n=1 Tax=Vanrija pseudolonga TaxID=143232 RepID=A0AAF1BQX5_9TREE|nr:hypothetical protein LOC62_03G004971 [Vanrija pseudolonga]
MSTAPTPIPADALNRYRIAHPDREVKTVIRRLTRLPLLAAQPVPDDSAGLDHAQELAYERELVRLEVDKWRLGVERTVVSVRTLERQRESYLSKTAETVERTRKLRQTLEEEKVLLKKGLAERDHRVKCDEVAKKIVARGKTRKELEAQIDEIKASLAEHRALYEQVLAVAQARADTFTRITALVEECRALKPAPEALAVDGEMDVDDAPEASGKAAPRLSATTLPFQPSAASGSSSRPASKSPAPHPLPTRPGRTAAAYNARSSSGPASLPQRPSSLRNVTGSLEEGELGDDGEDGEVKEAGGAGGKRKAAPEAEPAGRETRSTRSRTAK